MTGKKLISISLITMLILSMLSILSTVIVSVGAVYTPPSMPPYAWFYTDPDPAYFYSEDVDLTCTYFNVTVNLAQNPANVSTIQGYEFKLTWNTTILNATAVYKGFDPAGTTWGPVGPAPYYPWTPLQNVSDGFVWVIAAFALGMGTTANFTCVTITFHIEMAPPRDVYNPPLVPLTVSYTCDLDLYDTVIGSPAGLPISHSAVDGFYEYERGQIVPGKPIIDIDWLPLYPTVCDEVTVDASGTDANGAGDFITLWDWTLTNVTGGATWTDVGNKSVVKFHCDGPGDVQVTLYVEDNEGQNNTKSVTISQTLLEGPVIDLFTQTSRQYPDLETIYDGTGPNAPADSFSTGENVSLWAYVTYNGDPVQNILVGFEVLDPLGRCVTYRVDRTNETGYAQVWFRIPIPCDPAEQAELFGHWWVMAKCKLQDDIISDVMEFKVGWIIEITDLVPLQDPLIKGDTACFNVTLKNIAWMPRDVTVIVVVYDECDVPIGQFILEFNMPAAPNELCSNITVTKTLCIDIPKWAYVGIGKVYANAFTDLPQNCGIPYCPEVSETVIIDPSP